jgi:hypothetical protein
MGGVAIFIIAFVVANTDEPGSVRIVNPAIEALIPAPGSEVLRQSQVGVDLAPGFEAELVINGVQIPPDELNVLRDADDPQQSASQTGAFGTTINRFTYQPLEGRAVPELQGDENCVVATFWATADPTNIDTVEWCFNTV